MFKINIVFTYLLEQLKKQYILNNLYTFLIYGAYSHCTAVACGAHLVGQWPPLQYKIVIHFQLSGHGIY